MANITGDASDNILTGTPDFDTIDGLGGNDTLSGLGSLDTLRGGDGNDILNGGDESDTLYGEADDDTLNGEGGADSLYGGAGINILNGGDGSDYILSQGTDELLGGAGMDRIHIFGHATLIDGGADEDWIFFSGGVVDSFSPASSVERFGSGGSLYGTNGDNLLDFSATSVVTNPGDTSPTGLTIRAEGGNDTVVGTHLVDTIYGGTGSNSLAGGGGGDTIYSDGADTVDGGDGNDTIYLAGGLADANRTIVGGAGSDRLVVTNVVLETFYAGTGLEVIYLGGANAIVNGTDGHNILNFSDLSPVTVGGPGLVVYGGLGGDALTGTQGFDSLYGGVGGDFVDGQGGNDKVYGGDGNDIVHGNLGNDVVAGEAGHDTVYGGEGNDTESGGDGDDELWGDGGADGLKGENGNDILVGGLGDDVLTGGADNDVLTGGQGKDTLSGGLGADRFVFADGDLTGDSATTDRINDFKTANADLLDLAAIDADTGTAGDQAFVIVGAFSNVAGQATLSTVSGTTTLAMDTNGDGAADLLLLMTGTVVSTAGWIL